MAMSSSGVSGPSSYSSSSSSSMTPSLPNSITFQQQRHRSPIPSKGYPRQILGQAPNEIDPNFLCASCEELLREPVQASCGHRFCLNCLNQLIEGHTGPVLCPQCNREGVEAEGATIDADRFPDKAIKRLLGKQKVVCANPGCPWKGILVEFPSHEDACPMASVTCPHCGCEVELPRSEMASHVNECPRRMIACKYCSSPIPAADMDEHSTSCPAAGSAAAEEDDFDVENLPPEAWKAGRKCPYGCEGRSTNRESFEAHEKQYPLKHLQSLHKRLKRLELTSPEQASASKASASETNLVTQARQPTSEMEHDSEMEDMDETGPGLVSNVGREIENLQRRAVAAAAGPATTPGVDNAARIAAEIQKISERLRTLESERFVRSDSVPSSSSGDSLSHPQQQQQSSGFAFTPGGTPPRPSTSTAPTREDLNSNAMRKLELCFRKAETYEGMAMVLNVSLDRLLTQVTEIDNQRRREGETREAQERKIQLLEHALALKDVALADQLRRLELMESTSYNGILVWKINDFAKKKLDAMNGTQTSIYSPCFFTSRFGYKMCARIYLNGDGMGKGKYVSLFFVIMRSQYDALLTWPFKQKVTLMLLDQGPSGEHVVDAFRPDPNSSSFKRPVSEMNIASGCPLFVPLNLLESTRTYLKDDTAFVKIIVDTQGLQE